MSVAGCYTDFHIDMGGTSVWYHILKGSKVRQNRKIIISIQIFWHRKSQGFLAHSAHWEELENLRRVDSIWRTSQRLFARSSWRVSTHRAPKRLDVYVAVRMDSWRVHEQRFTGFRWKFSTQLQHSHAAQSLQYWNQNKGTKWKS